MRIEFCLPAKNEENILTANAQRLALFLQETGLREWQIVVIVNGSSDSSAQLAAGLAGSYPEHFLSVIYQLGGKGRALREYFKDSQADVLVFMDIDLAVDLKIIPGLLQPVVEGGADLVLGSRLMAGSRTDRSIWRSLTSRSYNQLSRFILGHQFSDLQCGFKAVSRSAYSLIQPHLRDEKWFFDTELVVIAQHLGLKILEIPVAWQENRYAARKSKVSVFYDAWAFIKNILVLWWRLKNIPR